MRVAHALVFPVLALFAVAGAIPLVESKVVQRDVTCSHPSVGQCTSPFT